jgi:hypothetical protein
LNSASSVVGSSPPSAASATRRAKVPGWRICQRIATRIINLDLQRSSAATTRRARVRSGVTNAAVFPGVAIASRREMAMARASSSALAVSIIVTAAIALSAAAEIRGSESGAASDLWSRPGATLQKPASPAMGSRICKRFDGIAGNANARQQCLHRELRVYRGGRVLHVLAACELLPGGLIKIGVESGENDRAVRKLRDRRKHFAVAGIEPVEPAAITGWFEPARRFISASMRRSRRRAASIMPFSARRSGQ